ncbi:class I SAM-dependent methyltransferase [Afifella pfennigii]|uniref:class I SAM-dependent methyltransferase n=1 Tax=Afifella pfennigii TaxID=209897 RepID=UPI00047A4C2D|nr:methyltransferase domain-containing protein [Afifella pfennigii]
MHVDVAELRDFYAGLLGRMVTRHIREALRTTIDVSPSDRILGLGFATPFLGPQLGRAERVLAFMPAPQGVLDWPPGELSATALVEDTALPLPDAAVDLAILVHALETSSRPPELMAELRRVLTANGRLFLVVPNRQGAWARSDTSPFGYGRPYSRSQLRSLLGETGFNVVSWATALHMWPTKQRSLLSLSPAMEKIGRHVWPAFAGVTCVYAQKSTIAAVTARPRRRFAPALEPALQPGVGMVDAA